MGVGLGFDPVGISIHAPREGSDRWAIVYQKRIENFYPRSPRGERRESGDGLVYRVSFLSTLPARGATQQVSFRFVSAVFLSTLPARGATRSSRFDGQCLYYFYPRSPRGERPGIPGHWTQADSISIHAPREGSDALTAKQKAFVQISIHAPREGSDIPAPPPRKLSA